MPELRIRNVEQWIVETFRTLAKLNGHSMESEIKDVLRRHAIHPREELSNELKAMTEELQNKYGLLSDSAQLIREDRDSRG